jgi:hypothetical protein
VALGRFRYTKYADQREHYAEVEVDVKSGTGSIGCSLDVFDWLRGEYGPDAREGPLHDDWRQAAMAGVRTVLTEAGIESSFDVRVLEIRAHPAHSISADITAAAAEATRLAIAAPGDDPRAR